ncbi:single-stranded DNA-binding protein, partial [Bifidobacterium longum]
PMAQPQPQQPTMPANDPWNATGAQTRQPAFTDGFAPAASQQPAI